MLELIFIEFKKQMTNRNLIIALIILTTILVGCTKKPAGYISYHQNENYVGCKDHLDDSPFMYRSDRNTNRISDCDLELNREYWRVYGYWHSVYMLPRPDASKTILNACKNLETSMLPLFKKYDLCNPIFNREQVQRINSMPIQDALLLSHYLHSKLRFKVVKGHVSPYPKPSDVLIACKTQKMTVGFKQVCDRYQEIYGHCLGPPISTELKSPDALFVCTVLGVPHHIRPWIQAERLNELYGID